MKKIDAHAHIGEIGGWANVAATPQQLLEPVSYTHLDVYKRQPHAFKNACSSSFR